MTENEVKLVSALLAARLGILVLRNIATRQNWKLCVDACVEQLDVIEHVVEPFLREITPNCPDCQECTRHSYSDATTPGFFYQQCELHRMD